MLKIREFKETLLRHTVQPYGPLPTISDPEGVYPYVSYCETARRPTMQRFTMVSIENRHLKVTVCPDLGGKVHSIVDKASGKEILFQAEAVRPVRILPRMAFISGGIEVSFPISHTPVQIENVHYLAKQIGERVYIWCGEREVRYGMQWTVEYSLGLNDRFLTQRTLFLNVTQTDHPWMSWSNAAVLAQHDTEMHFPDGKVLRHGDALQEIEWSKDKRLTMNDFDRMLGFFWLSSNCNAFGAFTPSLGCGLYHIADAAEVPGIKLWVYGLGKHEPWSQSTALRKQSYLEIQAGPIKEQAIKNILPSGETHLHTEYWFPTTVPLQIQDMKLPAPELVSQTDIPLFGFVPRQETTPWLRLLDAYVASRMDESLAPPEPEGHCWPPSGIEDLGDALRWSISSSVGEARRLWQYYLGTWQAGRGEIAMALKTLAEVELDCAHALRGRLLRTCADVDAHGACEAFRQIKSDAWKLHPQIVIERDLALAALGKGTLDERAYWLERIGSLDDEYVVERRAAYLLDSGHAMEARKLLLSIDFERVHQRYVRTELWKRIETALGNNPNENPQSLGEDDLAEYGQYRSNENPIKI